MGRQPTLDQVGVFDDEHSSVGIMKRNLEQGGTVPTRLLLTSSILPRAYNMNFIETVCGCDLARENSFGSITASSAVLALSKERRHINSPIFN
jgi:hypothetical protein